MHLTPLLVESRAAAAALLLLTPHRQQIPRECQRDLGAAPLGVFCQPGDKTRPFIDTLAGTCLLAYVSLCGLTLLLRGLWDGPLPLCVPSPPIYKGNTLEALNSAIRVMKETGAHAVKVEGGQQV